ncbi:TetR/AcrR family transcriptional regulator [Streptomyces orinoci]|uniref:TetR/AcrR family transcriptional regulator n=1 Tax=Streptomyces orinoci TaxID=67339 RepID=A0ABV3JXW8_STRON|nr:TetR/AcrR family transcriptional regulator [Streptomyces orinoci]
MAGAGRTPQTSVWLSQPKPRQAAGTGGTLDRDRIVAATVRLLDAEGLAKFSMRRLAAELKVTAMSVYWYVDTKDDLLELALDAVCGEMRLPDASDRSADWRDQLRQLATEYRDALVAHPWVTQLLTRYLNLGPSALALSNAALSVMSRSGVPEEKRNGALGALFQFVYGFAAIESVYLERCRTAGLSQDEYFASVVEAFSEQLRGPDAYDEVARAMDQKDGVPVAEMRRRDFAIAVETVIAGMEALRDRAQETAE